MIDKYQIHRNLKSKNLNKFHISISIMILDIWGPHYTKYEQQLTKKGF